jgi:hypothetical protein
MDWTVIDPPLSGANLNDVWGSAANDIFAVGAGSTILHYDGANWSRMDAGVGVDLRAVWGSSAHDTSYGQCHAPCQGV